MSEFDPKQIHPTVSVESRNGETMSLRSNKSLTNLFSSCSFSSASPDIESDDENINGDELMSIVTSMRSIYPPSALLKAKPTLPTTPPPLNEMYWVEPTAESFNVRGKNYISDRKKYPSQNSFFRLFAVDLVRVNKPILKGMANHPNERIQQCLKAQREKKPGSEMPPFIFCVNITVPGKPVAHHLVMYYAVDDFSLIDPSAKSTENGDHADPFRRLASRFFFGDSDSFRDSTFKLIPRIVKGNMLVKKAVGSKPTILGKKLKQHYIQDEKFFELVIDVGSDKIAKKVVGLATGYAKTLVVDMGFLLEGKQKVTLPEGIMGTVRLTNIDFKADLRTVEDY